MKNKKLFLILLGILPLLGVGCINISTSKTSNGGVFRSLDGAETWEQKVFVRQDEKKVITIGDVNPLSFVFHPQDSNVIYLGTENHGLIVSRDGGESWTPSAIATGNGSAFSIDPEVPATVYMARGSSIIKTVDDLVTWETVYLEPRGIAITDVHVDRGVVSRLFATTASGDILRSEDFGETWDTIHTLGVNLLEIIPDPGDSRVWYIKVAGQGLLKTTDSAASFQKILDQLAAFPGAATINDLYFLPNRTNVLYIATPYGILTSQDGGSTWIPIQTLFPAGSITITTVLVDPNDQNIIYFPVGSVIHKTADGGATWKTIETLPSTHGVRKMAFHPDDSHIVYATVTIIPKK